MLFIYKQIFINKKKKKRIRGEGAITVSWRWGCAGARWQSETEWIPGQSFIFFLQYICAVTTTSPEKVGSSNIPCYTVKTN